jgi:hypothetical protein
MRAIVTRRSPRTSERERSITSTTYRPVAILPLRDVLSSTTKTVGRGVSDNAGGILIAFSVGIR